MPSSLQVAHVHKSFQKGAQPVLKDVFFETLPGELVVLVGPSGCGKSTMLRAIAGLESVDQGKILLDGRDITRSSPKDRDMAMVFQDYALYPHKTVYENIAFGLRMRKMPEAELDQAVRAAAVKLNLSDYLKRKPAELSGGQRQRVAIGRALVRQPKVFLFDEPLSNLDAKLRSQMRMTIGRLHQELNATILYVTHDQVEAMTLADRIVVLNKGQIQQMGTPMELYHQPTNVFVASFIGSPPMNLFSGTLVRNAQGDICFRCKSNALGRASGSEGGLTHPAAGEAGSSGHTVCWPRSWQAWAKQSPKMDRLIEERTDLIWGLRPEELVLSERNHDRSSQLISLEGRLIFSEVLGASSTLLCQTENLEFTALHPGHRVPKLGEEIAFQILADLPYLFDDKTEQCIDLEHDTEEPPNH